MATIVYLDVEDEITSAATRIRSAGDPRVAIVLPFGSRLATSRINFRLLAREALAAGRRLSIVAPDAAARALAASAGLSVFASIGEFEASLGASPGPGIAGEPAAAASAALAGAPGGPAEVGVQDAPGTGSPTASGSGSRGGPGAPTPASSGWGTGQPGQPRIAPAPPRRRVRVGAPIGFALLGVGLVAAVVAAWFLLPAADISLTPSLTPIGPVALSVRADPNATAVDAASGVIPALSLAVPVKASGEFPATGKKVDEAKATGSVRWTSCDTGSGHTIATGTTVRTAAGIAFTTDAQVVLPPAALSGPPGNPRVTCATGDTTVTAVVAGLTGNVVAGDISVVPSSFNRRVVTVANASPTSGGTHVETVTIAQADIDAAIAQLSRDLATRFTATAATPPNVPAGATVFPDTASLGTPTPDTDPATLVGQETSSFTLSVSATGHVLAVDATPIKAIAAARLGGSVSSGYRLVTGSVSVTVGQGMAVNGVVSFAAQASAQQVRQLDAAELRRKVLGLSRGEATSLLAAYGDAKVSLWPDWIGSVPSFEQRVTLTVLTPGGPGPSPGPASSGGASPSTSTGGSPSARLAASAVPS
jgi:hypothetical protein